MMAMMAMRTQQWQLPHVRCLQGIVSLTLWLGIWWVNEGSWHLSFLLGPLG